MKIEIKLPIYEFEVDIIWIFIYFTWKDELDREDFQKYIHVFIISFSTMHGTQWETFKYFKLITKLKN